MQKKVTLSKAKKLTCYLGNEEFSVIVVSITADCASADCASADCASADCASADWSCLSIQRAAPCTPRIPFIASHFFGAQRAAQWKLIRTGLSLIIKNPNIIKTPLFQLSGRKSDQYNLWCYHCPSLEHTALSARTRLPPECKTLRCHQDSFSSVISQEKIWIRCKMPASHRHLVPPYIITRFVWGLRLWRAEHLLYILLIFTNPGVELSPHWYRYSIYTVCVSY